MVNMVKVFKKKVLRLIHQKDKKDGHRLKAADEPTLLRHVSPASGKCCVDEPGPARDRCSSVSLFTCECLGKGPSGGVGHRT